MHLFCLMEWVLALACLLGSVSATYENNTKRDLSFSYGGQKVRGVNLGGWFVLEPWIRPSLFDQFGGDPSVADEFTFCARLGHDECLRQLENHWNTWYTETDFQQIAAAGLNHVRIPIGYWAVAMIPGDTFVMGQLSYLDRAIGWAQGCGLKVWIDLHGAPGSQNGFDNSGRRGGIMWQSGFHVPFTVEVIRTLARKYSRPEYRGVVAAIQLLNEPMGWSLDMNALRQYWYDGWGTVRDYGDLAVIIHDAFQPILSWNGFMGTGFNNVILDTHNYQVFGTGELGRNIWQHIGAACDVGGTLRKADKWTVVGEWSAALTDCTRHLNGLGSGSRWDGTLYGPVLGSCDGHRSGGVSQFSAEEKISTRRFVEAQLDSFEQGAGWFFWTWKTEGSPGWDMRDLLANNLFPLPLTVRQFPNQCPGFGPAY